MLLDLQNWRYQPRGGETSHLAPWVGGAAVTPSTTTNKSLTGTLSFTGSSIKKALRALTGVLSFGSPVLARDDFNRANATLTAPWGDSPLLDEPASVVSNQMQASGALNGDDSIYAYTGITWPNDHYAKVRLVAISANRSPEVFARLKNVPFTSGVGDGYFAYVVGPFGSTVTIVLARWIAHAYFEIYNSGATKTVAAGDILEIRAIGTTISVWLNGVQQGSGTDASHTSGYAGIGIAQFSTSGTLAEAIADDWEGGTFTAANGFVKKTLKSLTAGLSFVGAQAKKTFKGLTGVLSFVGNLVGVGPGGGTLFTQSLTAALSFTGAFIKSTLAKKTGALSFTGAQSKITLASRAATLSFTGAMAKAVSAFRTATLSFSGAVTKTTSHPQAASLSFIGSIAKRAGKNLTGVLSFTGAMARVTGAARTATLSFTGAMSRFTAKLLAAGLSFSGVMNAVKSGTNALFFTATLTFTGAQAKVTSHLQAAALSFTGAMTARTSHLMTAALSFSGSLLKRAGKALAGVLSFTGAIATIKFKVQAFTASLSFTGAQTLRTFKSMPAVLSFSGFFSASRNGLTQLALTATLAFNGAMTKVTSAKKTATLSFTGAWSNVRVKLLTGVLSFAGSTKLSTRKALASTLSFAGALPKRITHSFQAALAFTVSFLPFFGLPFAIDPRWLLVMRQRVRSLVIQKVRALIPDTFKLIRALVVGGMKMDFSPKAVGETESFSLNFAPELGVGETITAATWTATPINGGVDPNSSTMIQGLAVITGSIVTQKITGGVAGVTYMIQCAITTSLGPQTIFGRANLAVTA